MERRALLQRMGAFGALGATGALALAGCQGPVNDPAAGGDDGGDSGSPGETGEPWDGPVTDVTIETVGSDCAGDERPAAEVAFDPETSAVTIAGTVSAPTPCHRTTIESVAFDAASGDMEVVLGTAPGTADGCVQCVGALDFECRVTVEGDLPSTVSVRQTDVQLARVERGENTDAADEISISGAAFDLVGRTGASGDPTADVTFHEDENRITISGTIHGSDGCKTAALDEVTYDAGDDRVTISVVTQDREGTEDQMCTQGIVAISYEAVVTFDGGTPGGASVVHDGHGVVSAGYGSASASAPPTTDEATVSDEVPDSDGNSTDSGGNATGNDTSR